MTDIPIRQYNRIFAGHNEERGYTSPLLSYGVSSRQFHFYTDAHNIFKFPDSLSATDIIDTAFIDSGSFPGALPLYSDYINFAPNCEILGEDDMRDDFGPYLCTWLYRPSLATSAIPIWIDRWYDPLDITQDEAFTIELSADSRIKDEISRLQLKPGVEYDYFRIGSYTNETLVSRIDTDKNLLLNFEDWNEANVNIAGGTTSNDKSDIVNKIYPLITAPEENVVVANDNIKRDNFNPGNDIVLDIRGSAYAYADYSSSLINNNDFSVGVWAKTDKWDDSNQKHLLSNGFRSGWNLKVNTGFHNPLACFFTESASDPNNPSLESVALIFTIENKLFFQLSQDTREDTFGTYIYESVITSPDSYIVDDDMFMYVLHPGGGNKVISKIDILNGVIVDQSDPLGSVNFSAIRFNKDGDIVALAFENYQIVTKALDLVGVWTLIDYDDIPGSAGYYDINANNETIKSATKVVTDNFNHRWEIGTDNKIYRRRYLGSTYEPAQLIYDVNAEDIRCSHDDKLWVITNSGSRSLVIYDISEIQFILDNPVLTLLATEIKNNDISFLTSNYRFSLFNYNNEVRAFVVDDDEEKSYIMTDTGSILKTRRYNLPQTRTLVDQSECTTYDWHRKFSYIKNNRLPAVELQVTYRSTPTSPLSTIQATFPVDNLIDNEWHHFGFTYASSAINLYMDTILLSTIDTALTNNIFHIYETPLTIGVATGTTDLLSRQLGLDNYGYFDGYFDDLRIYDDILTQAEYERIYTQKFLYKDLALDLRYDDMHYYVEEIERFFKFKLPGSKSQLFNIKITGFRTSSEETKQTIEGIISNTIENVAPAYTELYKITWID
jgi:hypothetical protein